MIKKLSMAVGFAMVFAAGTAYAKQEKVDVCHVPPDDPTNAHIISIPLKATLAHMWHGDLPPGGQETGEYCSDGIDNDCDGQIDTAADISCEVLGITIKKEVKPTDASDEAFVDANDVGNALSVESGTEVTYRYTIANEGTGPIDVAFSDDPLGDICDLPSLESNTSDSCTVTTIISCETDETVTNVGTAVGTSLLSGNTVEGADPAVVNCVAPQIEPLVCSQSEFVQPNDTSWNWTYSGSGGVPPYIVRISFSGSVSGEFPAPFLNQVSDDYWTTGSYLNHTYDLIDDNGTEVPCTHPDNPIPG